MKSYRWLIVLLLPFMLRCTPGGTYPVALRYQPLDSFANLKQKLGPTAAIAPFNDTRMEKLYIGISFPLSGSVFRFQTHPLPLDQSLQAIVSDVLARHGIKTVSIPAWDGNPESLKDIKTDSVILIDIRDFWLEGKGGVLGTNVKIAVHLIIHLGIKKENKVFTRNVDTEKEMTVTRLTPEKVEEIVDQVTSEIFDAFFSNPY